MCHKMQYTVHCGIDETSVTRNIGIATEQVAQKFFVFWFEPMCQCNPVKFWVSVSGRLETNVHILCKLLFASDLITISFYILLAIVIQYARLCFSSVKESWAFVCCVLFCRLPCTVSDFCANIVSNIMWQSWMFTYYSFFSRFFRWKGNAKGAFEACETLHTS